MAKFGVAAAIAVSYAALDLVGFDPQNGKAAARELHLIFALQPTASWMIMIGLLIWMQRELAIAAPRKYRPLSFGQMRRFPSAFRRHARGGWADTCTKHA